MSIINNFLTTINEDIQSDIVDIENKSLEYIINNNIPVSFDTDLKPISFWHDDVWIFSSLNLTKKNINVSQYKEIMNSKLFEEFKLSIYTLFLKSYIEGNKKDMIKIASVLAPIFENASIIGFKSITKINNELNFIKLLEQIKGLYSTKTLEGKLIALRDIEKLNLKSIPLNIKLNSKKRKFEKNTFSINELSKKYANQKKLDVEQSLYIPQKIHSNLINECINKIEINYKILDKIDKVLEEDLIIFQRLLNNFENNGIKDRKLIIDKIKKHRESKSNKDLSIRDLLKKHKIYNRFNNYEILKQECREIAASGFCLIATFTGMRANEIFNIKTDGYRKIKTDPELHVIRSFETKISGGQSVDYITSPIIEKVFESLIKIQNITRKYGNEKNKDKLFCSESNQKLLSYGDPSQMRKTINNFAKKINLKIDKESFKEHIKINGVNNSIKQGNIWPIKAHQFRRTLIMNFVAHNLSDLSAVKQQVKHMYSTMTEYYANNSQVLSQLKLNTPDSILSDIEDERLDENVRNYKEFYYGKEHLSGKKGVEIEKQRAIIDVLSDEEIKMMFKSGAYKLTRSTYGFCTKGDLCDKNDIADPSFCGISCNTMIITKNNALEWKKLYNRNQKLLKDSDKFLMIGNMKMKGAITMMKNQNMVAEKILKEFNIEA